MTSKHSKSYDPALKQGRIVRGSAGVSNSVKKILDTIVRSAIIHSDDKKIDLLNVVKYAAQSPHRKMQPPFLEIGTRAGGSAFALLKVIEKFFANTATLITVDPYGDKPYDDKPWLYGDQFYVKMKKLLASYTNHIHYYMTSGNFIFAIKRLTFWRHGKKCDFTKFSFVYLDGSHQPQAVRFEIESLFPKIISHGYLVVDNTDYYNGAIQRYLSRYAKKRGLGITHSQHQSVLQQE